MFGCFTSNKSLLIHVQDHSHAYMHIISFLAWAWSVFEWLCCSIYFHISCRCWAISGLSAYRFREGEQIFPDLHKMPCIGRLERIVPFLPTLLDSPTCGFFGLVYLFCITLCRHLLDMLSYLPDSVQCTSLSTLMSHRWLSNCRRNRRSFYAVAHSNTFCFFMWRLAYTLLVVSWCLWKVEQGRRLLSVRPATHMLWQACGFTSTGNNSGGKDSDGWFILASAVPDMLLSGVRTAAMCQYKVSFRNSVFMHI